MCVDWSLARASGLARCRTWPWLLRYGKSNEDDVDVVAFVVNVKARESAAVKGDDEGRWYAG